MKKIVLVGFMGTGKTVVAKELAKRLGVRYISTDEMIEARERMPIADIFAKKGEGHFRDIESAVVAELSKITNAVVDTGGGIVTREANISNLRKGSVIICLTAAIEEILRRTKRHRHRPLLNVEDPKAASEALLASRATFYAKADHTIDTTGLSVPEVVERIIGIIGR
jgi:shikimate kinase